MSDKKTPPEPSDWSHLTVPSIPADDPIYSEGVIITFPIKPSAPAGPPPPDEEEKDYRTHADGTPLFRERLR